MDKPYISIVLPVYNSEKTLSLCLNSLTNLDYPKENFEIIVVDNNSTDRTKDIIRNYRVRYLLETKKGASAALNKGIKNSLGEIIAFTHSDCIVERKWLNNIVKGFSEDDVGGCQGDVLSYNPKSLIERYCDYRRLYFQNGNVAKDKSFLPWIMVANAAFRRDVLNEVGLFDEFFSEEYDIDLSFRVCLKGYQLKYIPEAKVYHKYRDTLIGLWRQRFKIGCNSPKFLKKYGKLYKTVYIVPCSLLYVFKAVLNILVNFFNNLFKEKGIKIIFPLFDFVVYFALFLGAVSGSISLHSKEEKIK